MITHSITDKIIKVLNSGNRKPKNIWLYGEAGLGKSETAKHVADKLGLKFYSMSLSSQTTVFKLTGFLDANSNYKPTPLRLAYENGGLICLEECDTVNSGVLVEINNILSQDEYSFPDKTVSRHKDFKLICCANSNGKSDDIKYSKSQQIDASTLDRFIFMKIELDMDLAKYLTNNDDWFNRVMEFRKAAKSICGDEIIIGMRALIDGADLLDAGFSQSEVEDMVIYKGIDEDIVESIKNKMDCVVGEKINLTIGGKPVQISNMSGENPLPEINIGKPPDGTNTSDIDFNTIESVGIVKDSCGEKQGYLDKEFVKKNPELIAKLMEIIKGF